MIARTIRHAGVKIITSTCSGLGYYVDPEIAGIAGIAGFGGFAGG